MTKLEKVIDSCIAVFELTSRSVPSNHLSKINEELAKLKQVKEELKAFDSSKKEDEK